MPTTFKSRRGANSGIAALLLAVLVLAAPASAAVAEGLSAPDPRLSQAISDLSLHEATADLPDLLANSGVAIRFVPMAPNLYARYSLQRQAIEVDSRWSDVDTTTLTAVLAHEGTHAKDAVNGYLASGGATACVDSEVRAFRTSALVWLDFYGPAGKAESSGDLERQLNLIADRFSRDPEGLDLLVKQAYTDQCSRMAPVG